MLRLATDERFSKYVINAMFRDQPDLDLVRMQEYGLHGAPDPDVLAWAATEGRVLVSYDRATMLMFAWERVQLGQSMPGLIVVRRRLPPSVLIFELLLHANCLEPYEMENQVIYIP